MFIRVMMAVVLGLTVSAAAAQEKRLDYRQEGSLKDAVYYLNQVEGIVGSMEKASAKWKAKDPSVSVNDVNGQLQHRDRATQYLNNASTRLKALPADHSKVKPELKRYDDATGRLAKVEAKLVEIKKGLDKVVKQGETPAYRNDFDRLKEINQMFADPSGLRSRPAQAVEAAKQVGAAKAERERIAQKYDDLLKQPTGEAKQMREVLAHSERVFGEYEKALKEWLDDAPGEVEKGAAEAVRTAKEGVNNNKPGYFGEQGGVRQRLAQARETYEVLAALSPDGAGTARAKRAVDEAKAATAEMGAKFIESTVASNPAPEDGYHGSDEAALVNVLREKWAKGGNGTAVLKVGVRGPNWQRTTRWEWSAAHKGWEKVDKSRIQGFVVVKVDDRHAAVWWVNLVKDHLNGDVVAAHFVSDPKKNPDVTNLVLVVKVK